METLIKKRIFGGSKAVKVHNTTNLKFQVFVHKTHNYKTFLFAHNSNIKIIYILYNKTFVNITLWRTKFECMETCCWKRRERTFFTAFRSFGNKRDFDGREFCTDWPLAWRPCLCPLSESGRRRRKHQREPASPGL